MQHTQVPHQVQGRYGERAAEVQYVQENVLLKDAPAKMAQTPIERQLNGCTDVALSKVLVTSMFSGDRGDCAHHYRLGKP